MPPSIETKHTGFLSLKFAAADRTSGIFEGYASVFGVLDSYGDIVLPGAFAKSLAEHKAEGTLPVLLWAHDPQKPAGRWLEMREDDIGLWTRGQLNLGTTTGKDAHAHVQSGDVNGLSIGYRVVDERFDEKAGANILKTLDVMEVSLVTMPANRQARITSKRDLENLLTKAGLARGAAEKIAAGGMPALLSSANDDQPDLEPLHQALKSSLLNIRNNLK